MRLSETALTGPSPSNSVMTTSITSHTAILGLRSPVAENPFLPTEPWRCAFGAPSLSGNTVPAPVSSQGSSSVIVSGTTFSPMGTDGPLTMTEPLSTAPVSATDARRTPLSLQNDSTASWTTSPSSRRSTNTLPCASSALLMDCPQRYLLYLSRSLPILSASSLVRSPASRKVLTKSFASLVETRDAFAMTLARNDEAFAGSIVEASRI